MKQRILAQRYAKALLGLGLQAGISDKLAEEAKDFVTLLSSHEELRNVFNAPVFAQEKRQGIVRNIAEKKGYSKTFQHFLLFLVEKKRAPLFQLITEVYLELLDTEQKIVHVRVASATSMTESYLEQLKKRLETYTGKQVILQTEEDPNLKGGVAAWIGNKLVDGTIQTRMKQMKTSLLEQIQ